MPMLKPDIPFARDDANRFLPWIIGLMSFLIALLLFVGLSLSNWTSGGFSEAGTRFSVQLPRDGLSSRKTQEVMAMLKGYEGIESVELLDAADTRALLNPWIGDLANFEALPIPAIIRATLNQTQARDFDFKALTTRVRAIAPDASVDARSVWAEKLAALAGAANNTLVFFAMLIIAALAAMIIFTCRTAMRLHSRTVHLLHAFGADDDYISRQFERNALWLTLRGALPGCVAAFFLYMFSGYYIRLLDLPAMPNIRFTGMHGFTVLALPLFCGGVAYLSARVTTLRMLKVMP